MSEKPYERTGKRSEEPVKRMGAVKKKRVKIISTRMDGSRIVKIAGDRLSLSPRSPGRPRKIGQFRGSEALCQRLNM